MRSTTVLLVLPGWLLASGCSKGKVEVSDSRPAVNVGWIDVSSDQGDREFRKLVSGSQGYPVAKETMNVGEDGIPYLDGVTHARVLLKAKVYGQKVFGQQYLLASYDTGSGVANPVICLYKIKSSDATLRFVWHKRLKSIYGFNYAEQLPKGFKLKSDFPQAQGGRGLHTSVDLNFPAWGD